MCGEIPVGVPQRLLREDVTHHGQRHQGPVEIDRLEADVDREPTAIQPHGLEIPSGTHRPLARKGGEGGPVRDVLVLIGGRDQPFDRATVQFAGVGAKQRSRPGIRPHDTPIAGDDHHSVRRQSQHRVEAIPGRALRVREARVLVLNG